MSPPGWGGNLLRGLFNSVLIAVGAFSIGMLIGIAGAYGKLYGGPVLRDLLELYTTLVRAVPELVLILLLYFAGTDLINRLLEAFGYQRIDINGLVAGICVLGVVQGAYSTEVIRGAILGDPAGADRGGARLRHVSRPDAEAHHAARHAALRHSWPRQSLADRHQGHGAARHRRLQRTDAGDTTPPPAPQRPISPSSSPPA